VVHRYAAPLRKMDRGGPLLEGGKKGKEKEKEERKRKEEGRGREGGLKTCSWKWN